MTTDVELTAIVHATGRFRRMTSEVAANAGLPYRQVERVLTDLERQGRVIREGTPPRWRVAPLPKPAA